MKDKIMSFTFVAVLFIFFIINIVTKDTLVSLEERRKLTQFPEITIDTVKDGSAMKKFEEYSLDQFILRKEFRALKSNLEFNLFRKLDSNNIFVDSNKIYKIEYPLNEKSVVNFSKKINRIYDENLKGMNVYYSIIPDKNYYFEKELSLKMDYNKLYTTVRTNMNKNIKYIELRDILNKDDYYNTDTHWKQQNLFKVVDRFKSNMKFETSKAIMIKNEFSPFYGVYYGQLAMKKEPDKIEYLTNDIIDKAIVKNIENSNISSVYDIAKLGQMDSYDVFLSGATPIILIENSENKSGRELVIFRDSFGSSIAPLLIESYSKITLIDLRYINTKTMKEYIEFKSQDVLFLYSTLIINSSETLKE